MRYQLTRRRWVALYWLGAALAWLALVTPVLAKAFDGALDAAVCSVLVRH